MTSPKLRIFLADDHAIIRDGLALLIGTQSDMEVVGQAGDGRATIEQAIKTQPDVVVMDVSMPGMNGALVTTQLCQVCPGIRVVALTRHGEAGYVRQMLQAGAQGYVLKQAAGTELLDAIRTVASGKTYLDTTLANLVVHHFMRAQAQGGEPQEPDLSDREVEVVQLTAQGYTNKEIATQLGLSVKTVDTYKMRAMEKLGLHSRAALVRYALQSGWLESD
jgi:DNA-binding NarL/FixJ family response regulator